MNDMKRIWVCIQEFNTLPTKKRFTQNLSLKDHWSDSDDWWYFVPVRYKNDIISCYRDFLLSFS